MDRVEGVWMGYGGTNVRCRRYLERGQVMENGFRCGRNHDHPRHLRCLTGSIIVFQNLYLFISVDCNFCLVSCYMCAFCIHLFWLFPLDCWFSPNSLIFITVQIMKSSHKYTANADFVLGRPLLAQAFECLWLVLTLLYWWRPNLIPVELMHFWFPFFFFDEKNEFIKKKLKVY